MKHSEGFLKLVDDAKSRVREVSVADTQQRMRENGEAKLIDVREDKERDIEATVPDKNTELILYCGGGYRSALAADALQQMGYTNVFSMVGGWKAWNEAGGEVEQSTDYTEGK